MNKPQPARQAQDTANDALLQSLRRLSASFDGKIGIGVQSKRGVVGVNQNRRFSLQSVMKLVVAAAAMDAIDRRGWHLLDPVTVRKQDLSLNVQPLAKLVGDKGYATTLGNLIFRAVVQSDSAAADILFARLGGATAINQFLKRSAISDVHIDRDERHLQTEVVGLRWRPEYVDPAVLEQARKKVSPKQQAAAFQAYLHDVRDTATPLGMTAFLYCLAVGALLSPISTRHLLDVMQQTATFPDRLKAGVPLGWSLAHKTGTSGSWEGVTGTTNDVGILTASDKGTIAVSVFIAESRRPAKEQAAFIAEVARLVTASYSRQW